MNSVLLLGRLVRDPVLYQKDDSSCSAARFTLAVSRQRNSEQGQTADYISCVGFGSQAEFIDRYLAKGMQILVSGKLRTGSYVNKSGDDVSTADVVVDRIEFTETKAVNDGYRRQAQEEAKEADSSSAFAALPDDDADELPFE